MPPSTSTIKRTAARRRQQRDELWPDAAKIVFNVDGGGWAMTPRTIPMIASLLDHIGGKEHPGRVYVTLWAHEYGDGLVEVVDPLQLALEAGYFTPRAERTLLERLELLRSMGLIRAAPRGPREFAFILLLNPHTVLAEWYATKTHIFPKGWWSAFRAWCLFVGIEVPTVSDPNRPDEANPPDDPF